MTTDVDGVLSVSQETEVAHLRETVAALTRITNDIAAALDDANVEDPDSDSMAASVRILTKQRDLFEAVAAAAAAERRAAAVMNRSVDSTEDPVIAGEYWNAVDATDDALRLVGMLVDDDESDAIEE